MFIQLITKLPIRLWNPQRFITTRHKSTMVDLPRVR